MLYVAYGSNMNLNQMKFRCPKSRLLGVGKLEGWKLIFNIHADIIPTKDKENIVPIVLWDIDDEDWERLDMYEGYPTYYIKETIDVNFNGEIKKAIVYVMNNNCKGIALPYKDYFETIIEGYIENGIDTMFLYESLEYTYKNETEYNQYNNKYTNKRGGRKNERKNKIR